MDPRKKKAKADQGTSTQSGRQTFLGSPVKSVKVKRDMLHRRHGPVPLGGCWPQSQRFIFRWALRCRAKVLSLTGWLPSERFNRSTVRSNNS